jgi:hypothetical protein
MKEKQFIATMIGILLITGLVLAACDSGGGNDLSGIFDDRFAPNTPSGISAEAESSSSIIIKWNGTQNTRNYKIKRSDGEDGPWKEIALPSSTSVSYTDTKLSANKTYYYRVYACNKAGDSPDQRPVSATTKPAVVIPEDDDDNPGVGNPSPPSNIPGSSSSNAIRIPSDGLNSSFLQGIDAVWFTFSGNGYGYIGASDHVYSSNYTSDIVVDVYNSSLKMIYSDIDLGDVRVSFIYDYWYGTYYVKVKPKGGLSSNKGIFAIFFLPT